MDKSNAMLQGIRRRLKRNALAVQQDLALIRMMDAAENIHQGRFSGAVFTEQCADFAAA